MEQNYWMHRCKCGDNAWPFTHELLKKHCLISVGWSEFSCNEDQSRLTSGWESFEQMFKDWRYPRNRYNLWRFLNEMKQGDIVVVPLPGVFDVYRIADNTVYNNETIDHSLWMDWNGEVASLDKAGYPAYADGRQIDMGFYRKVEPVAVDIPRRDYAPQALFSRMKIQQTNANINDLRDEVEDAIKRFREHTPINLHNEFLDEAAKGLLQQMRSKLNDGKLEQLVEWYMQQLGANTYIPAKNSTSHDEGDADVIATFDNLNGFTILVQVKAHKDYTNDWAVQQINAYKQAMEKRRLYISSQKWVVSTCDKFSEEAMRMAEASDVRLVAGLEFARMLIENGIYSMPL